MEKIQKSPTFNAIIHSKSLIKSRQTKLLRESMPYLRVNLSNKTIELLDKLKQEYKLGSRSQTLEVIIEQLLESPVQSNLNQEE